MALYLGNTKIAGNAVVPDNHNHDDRYYTEEEITNLLADKVDASVMSGFAKMAIVSYRGTDNYGENNPTSITVDFEIKAMAYIGYKYDGSDTFTSIAAINTTSNSSWQPSDILTTTFTPYRGFWENLRDNATSYGKKSSDGKTWSWYNNSASAQLNNPNYTYYFLVLG